MPKTLSKTELLDTLKEEGYKFEVSGSRIKVFTSEDREQVLTKIKNLTKGTFSESGSSIGSVQIGPLKILVKPNRTGSAGSGAGAYITSLAESAQCYYCAAAWYQKDFSEKSLRAAAKYVQATASVEQVIKELPDNWIVSCTKSAKALYAQFGTKRYTFHRGSSFVQKINNNFLTVNRVQNMFSNINKWSPADIWMVTDKSIGTNFNFEDFNTFNAFLLKMAKNKELIGVSLKQTNTALVRKINFTGESHSYKFMSATVGKKGFFESKDVYLFYDGGEIQFRGFPTWQGEIKGKTANHGKISGGPTKAIVDRYSTTKLETQSLVEGSIKRKDPKFYKKFHELYQKTVGKIKYEDFEKGVKNKDLNWQSSKYLGTQLVFIMNTSNKRQVILSEFINYAKSQSSFSAAHIKVE